MEMAAGLIIAFSMVFVLLGCFVLFRKGWLVQWLIGSIGLALIGVAFYMGLFAANILNYEELGKEHPIATVSFEQKTRQEYIATVTSFGGEKKQYELKGDLWQLDARLLNWKGGLESMGFKPAYQLEKIEGRYFTLEDERGKTRSSYSMVKPGLFYDIWQEANEGWSPVLEASHASATYLPMADGAIFEVVLEVSGLASRPVNQAAEIALADWE